MQTALKQVNRAGRRSQGRVVLAAFTCKLSLVAGTAFITNPSTSLVNFINQKITINDGAQNLVGWIKAAGTGETVTDIVTGDDSTFASDTGWWSKSDASITINDATAGKAHWNNSTNGYGIYRANRATIGGLIKSTLTVAGRTGGGVKVLYGTYFGDSRVTDATYTEYRTVITSGTVGVLATSNGTTLDVDDLTYQRVLTPSATGVTIVSAAGGTTYNWTSNGGINPNATSFTVTITRV